MNPLPFATGWHEDPDEVQRIASLQPFPGFEATPAGQATGALPESVFLWDWARKVTGGLLPPRNQGQVGSCVAFGTARAVEYTLLAEIARGEPDRHAPLVEEAIYGGSRVEIGKGRLGAGDGSVGAWAAECVRQLGVINRARHGSWDLSRYEEARCRAWGKTGIPDDLEPITRTHPVRGIALIRDWEQAKRALSQGNAIAICSRVGFVMDRDADGFCRARGVWRHCMCLCGYQTGRREGGRLDNSWGAHAHKGPTGLGQPGPEGFWVDAQSLDGMLREGDSWAFSHVEGFPDRGPLHWRI